MMPEQFWSEAEACLMQAIEQQRAKVLRIAREINPRLTPDDVLNPQDHPELVRDPIFNFEDGLLAGLLSAHIALRVRLIPLVQGEQQSR